MCYKIDTGPLKFMLMFFIHFLISQLAFATSSTTTTVRTLTIGDKIVGESRETLSMKSSYGSGGAFIAGICFAGILTGVLMYVLKKKKQSSLPKKISSDVPAVS